MTTPRRRNSAKMLMIRAVDAAKFYVPFLLLWGSVEPRLTEAAGPLLPVVVFWGYTCSRLHFVLFDWWTTRYQLTEHGLTLWTGLLTRRRRAVGWADVSSTQVSRPWLHQALRCSRVGIGLGAQDKQVLTLEAVPDDVAAEVQARSRSGAAPDAPPAQEAAGPQEADARGGLVYAMRPIDYLLVSVTFGQFALFVPACLGTYSEVTRWMGSGQDALPDIGSSPPAWQLVVGVVALTAVALAYGCLVAWLRYAWYEVRLHEGTLTITGGLLSRESRQVNGSRTNGVKVQQNPLMRLMGYGKLSVVSRESGSARRANVVFPAARLSLLSTSTREHFPRHVGIFDGPPGRAAVHGVLVLAANLASLALAWAVLEVADVRARVAVLASLAIALLLLSNRAWATACVDTQLRTLSYRRGFLWVTRYAIPLASVHVATYSQGPVARLLGLANVAVDIHDARRVRLRLLCYPESAALRLTRTLLDSPPPTREIGRWLAHGGLPTQLTGLRPSPTSRVAGGCAASGGSGRRGTVPGGPL